MAMTYENASGELWNGMLADGTFDMTKIANIYKEYCGCEIRHPEGAIVDLIQNIHKGHRRKIHQLIHDSTQEALQCELPYACHFKYPTCDTYVLRVDSRSGSSRNPTSQYQFSIVEELRIAVPNRFLLLTFSNCKDMEQCTKEILEELGFVPTPSEGYKNYKSFSHAAKAMLQDSIEYFEAPCVKLLKHLEDIGFSGELDSY